MTVGKFLISLTLTFIILQPAIFAQSITINADEEYQTITGFGGMNNPGWISDLNEDQREKAFGNKPGQIGLSVLRMRISPFASSFESELPTALHAKSHGALLFASPWSPPAALKSNNDLVRGTLLPENYGAYTDHLLEFAKVMSDNGAPLYAISIQNEPDWFGATYESCDWTAQEIADFLKDQGERFDTLKVIAAESLNFNHDMTDATLNDTAAEKHVDIMGGHLYGGGLQDYPLAREKGKEIWMTEHLNGSDKPESNTWSLALATAIEINDCMKANFNEYTWWYIRRFYGLIDDKGNITKKGYAMSHFSKFVRRGAIRVDADVASVPNVDVTAYKTDTSMVIIVINKNSTNINLDFEIQNGTVDTLAQFTTSATKNMLNDGGISISGGTFNATVDAKSITTFASYTKNAGNYGNIIPTANAGDDLLLDDMDGNGSEAIMLDASSSIDTDGTITNFSWSMNGEQFAWDTTAEVNLQIGQYTVLLTITDNDGARDTDTIEIKVESPFSTEIWLEAECGQVGETWEKISNASASNEEYVGAPAGVESTQGPSSDTADLINFIFHVDEEANYKIWGRVISPSPDDDSFWVNVDSSSTWTMWNGIPSNSDWHWDDVHDQSNDNTMTYALDTGYHSLSICFREDGAYLDKILISNTGTIPTGMGGDATNCVEEVTNIANVLSSTGNLNIYPNPTNNNININWDNGFNHLTIYSFDGKVVHRKEYATQVNSEYLRLNLDPGVYLIEVRNKESRSVGRLMVE